VNPVPDRLLAFVDALRDNGIRVTQHEALDAMRALRVVGGAAFAERELLAATLRTSLIKRSDQEPVFDRVFAMSFAAPVSLEGPLAQALERALVARGVDAEVARELAAQAGGFAGDAGALAQAMAEGDDAAIAELIQAALDDTDTRGLTSPFQLGYFTQRVLRRLGVDDVDARARAIADDAADGDGQALRATLDERLLALRRATRDALRREYEMRYGQAERDRARLVERPLMRLDDDEVRRMRELVRRLAERLKARVKRREHRVLRGQLDVRRTLRASLGTDGVPAQLRWRRRRRDRPELIVLCDVSDSVRAASVFMLELVYSLTEMFRRVRSFVFVDRAGETTQLFRDVPIDDAISRVQAGESVSLFANSDYGAALTDLWAACGESITRRTTVVILGDGRTNYRPAHPWIVRELRRRARSVLWLCPEARGTWGFGDSEMPAYARASTRAFEVRTLAQLAAAIDRIAI
jgi:uncharacterized protein with von Willebrand factor type A (vWA) domain